MLSDCDSSPECDFECKCGLHTPPLQVPKKFGDAVSSLFSSERLCDEMGRTYAQQRFLKLFEKRYQLEKTNFLDNVGPEEKIATLLDMYFFWNDVGYQSNHLTRIEMSSRLYCSEIAAKTYALLIGLLNTHPRYQNKVDKVLKRGRSSESYKKGCSFGRIDWWE